MSRILPVVFLPLITISAAGIANEPPVVPVLEISCLSQSGSEGTVPPDPSVDGGWYRPRRDAGLTGRSPLIGDISCPEVIWSRDLSERGFWLELAPDSGSNEIALSSEDQGDTNEIDLKYDSKGAFIRDEHELQESNSGQKIGDFLDSYPGLERVSCDGERCYLHTGDGSAWEQVWASGPIPDLDGGGGVKPIVADMDADGELEAVVAPWYEMYILDLATGEIEDHAQFTDPENLIAMSGRAYGWMGAFNLDDDPKLELINLGDFLPTIQVLGWNDEGKFVELWDRLIDTTIQMNDAAHVVMANAVVDVDDDGDLEIVTNTHNETGDGRWRLLVLNGNTGEEEHNLADRYAAGVWDLDGDGIAELLVNEAGEGIVRENGPAIVLSLDGGQETELLRADGERILWSTIKSFPWHVNNASTFYKYHPSILAGWDGHHTAFATRSDAGESMQRIRLWTYDGSSISEAASVTGPSLQIQGSEAGYGSGSILVRSHFPHGQQGVITLEGMQVVGQHSRRLGRGDGERGVGLTELAGTLVLPRNKDVPLIVTQGFGQQIEALEVPDGQARPRTLWRVSGRGMAGNEGASLAPNEGGYGSVAGFDPFGTGEYHVALAGSGERGGGAIRVVRSDGTELWNREFPVFPEPPLWNNSGVTHWVGGHFRDTQTQDLYAVIRRSNQHTEQAFLLDGQSGDEVWRKREGALYAGCGEPVINEFQSGPSPALASLVDYDGDGLDDILDLANSTFTIYQGTSGDTLFNRWNTHGCPTQEGQYLSELLPERTDAGNLVGMVGPLEAGGPVQVLFGMNGETMARFDLDSSLDWYTPVGEGMPIFVLQVPADLDGDGVMEIVVVGHCGTPGSEIRAYDSGNGQLRWSLADASVCAGEPPISPSAADLDGDGRDEVVFTVQSAMHALAEEGGEGVIRWSARLEGGGSWETRLGAPVIADIDGSGWPAILVNTASGHLYALGGASAAARMAEREIIEGLRGGLCSLVSRLSRKPGC